MLQGTTLSLKQKASEEAKRMIVITAYLSVLLGVFELHRLAKVILIADALHAGKRLAGATMLATVILKSGIFAMILICFNIVEDVLVGLFHGKTLAESVPELAGGGLEGQLIVGVMIFVALIPFFAFAELRRAMGQDAFDDLVFRRKTR
jgi:hypothetical protein